MYRSKLAITLLLSVILSSFVSSDAIVCLFLVSHSFSNPLFVVDIYRAPSLMMSAAVGVVVAS